VDIAVAYVTWCALLSFNVRGLRHCPIARPARDDRVLLFPTLHHDSPLPVYLPLFRAHSFPADPGMLIMEIYPFLDVAQGVLASPQQGPYFPTRPTTS
jgi:hypothetical protein